MTFSIVARDPETGDLGIAVASKFLAVGAVVPWARAGVGAIATQAYANVRFGPDGLDLMAGGASATDALRQLTDADPGAAERQAGFVDATGRAATFTGSGCLTWAGGRTSEGIAAQGNILTGPEVVDAMLATYRASDGPFAGRLLAALLAGDKAGGDARGRQSAAILIVREAGGYAGGNDRWIDLRVDDHMDPVPELLRVWGVWRLLMERPDPADLLVIDAALGAELRERLTELGWAPGSHHDDGLASAVRAELDARPRTGEPLAPTADWGPAWDSALLMWMGLANLEERTAAHGLIDPAVLTVLRES